MNAWFARSKSSMLMLLDLDLDPRIHRSVDRTREKLILVLITFVATDVVICLFSATISGRRL